MEPDNVPVMPPTLAVRVLSWIAPPRPLPLTTVYDGKSKISALLGPDFWKLVPGSTILDFGCGHGLEIIELAKAGAGRAIGAEIDKSLLETARLNAEKSGVASRCRFTAVPEGPVDLIVSLDSFEHYAKPDVELQVMYRLLKPGGAVFASWGPPWRHPWGCHLQELPPWAHLLLSERTIMAWRARMRSDGATTYAQCGLNRMTIARFERLVSQSPFRVEHLEARPIRRLRWLHNRFTREHTTSLVQCILRKPA